MASTIYADSIGGLLLGGGGTLCLRFHQAELRGGDHRVLWQTNFGAHYASQD